MHNMDSCILVKDNSDHSCRYCYTFNSIQLLSVYFLNIRVSQLTKRIQDLQKDGDTARLYFFYCYFISSIYISSINGDTARLLTSIACPLGKSMHSRSVPLVNWKNLTSYCLFSKLIGLV